MPLRRAALPLLAATVLLPLAGCGGGSDESPRELLDRAKTTLDEAPSVHFTLDTAETPDASTGLLGGEGDLQRPASFQGTLQVLVAGSTVEVEVVSVDGTVYAQLPFTSGFSVVDPADFGIGDPASLLDPDTGISQLLAAVENPQLGEESRVDGEVVREVTGQIPGDLVEQLLTSQDPEQPVEVTFAITEEDAELRRAELTGPFFTAEDDATYIVELSDYGADVEITAPPTD
jgi:lipoprotein LprG